MTWAHWSWLLSEIFLKKIKNKKYYYQDKYDFGTLEVVVRYTLFTATSKSEIASKLSKLLLGHQVDSGGGSS